MGGFWKSRLSSPFQILIRSAGGSTRISIERRRRVGRKREPSTDFFSIFCPSGTKTIHPEILFLSYFLFVCFYCRICIISYVGQRWSRKRRGSTSGGLHHLFFLDFGSPLEIQTTVTNIRSRLGLDEKVHQYEREIVVHLATIRKIVGLTRNIVYVYHSILLSLQKIQRWLSKF